MLRNYEHALSDTAKLLATPMTAAALGRALGITMQGALNRIAALRERGVLVREVKKRLSLHGPPTTHFVIESTPQIQDE